MKTTTLALAATTVSLLALGAPAAAQAETACADLAKTRLPHAEVTKAVAEAVGDTQVCKVSVTSRPTKDSDIRLEVWIPVGAAWNGKFVQVGNGGFAGTVPKILFTGPIKAGYAVAGTDDGHQEAVGTSAAWALGHPEKVVDFGYRALKETTEISKALIAAQKGSAPGKSYFFGCSDGGREALMEAQRYPGDFDGIVAGAPANYMSDLFGLSAFQQQALAKPGGYLDAPARELLQKTSLAQCGGEAFIRDPAACHVDPGKLACKAGQTAGCLTAPQVASARAIYNGRLDAKGKVLFPGYSPGAEAANGSWNAWITGPSQDLNAKAAGHQFASNAFKYFGFQDPNFDFLKMDMGAQYSQAHAKMAPVIDSPDPNLAAFRKRGGKLIQYHGWNDPAIPPRSSIRYYEEVGRTIGDTGGFYRLYMVPGMLHCGDGVGPGRVEWLSLLDGWVSDKKAPGELTATAGPAQAPGGPPSQLLCPYPRVARKTGETWACAVPKKKG
ncbi:MAG: Tannase and feruloyl esterase [Phenylobacterium sp.]|uniref:tannase/feruloyl esterase family alpha/beta hydrolase n=1 Tax=Phenylobacterium sp. TaxID=1871053 RepID=UPI00260D64CD|nr:tannase/feruloyl esterase family alpha/beta hydrolase [Phenylobacterium sp.]MDB5499659.1 Tannase and feruloyl esterase [Phenylobacterium sp.]